MKSQPQLILASTSKYRRELLERLKIPFECRPPGVDETRLPGEPALSLVARLALLKAQAVARECPDACVIGSDQIAVLPGQSGEITILGKPGSAANCIEQLVRCSGQTLSFVTAVAVIMGRSFLSEFTDTTRVVFRVLDQPTIARYVEREAPWDCAGGFKSEGLGIALCESIESKDPSALIGLPLIELGAALRAAGFSLP